MPPKPQSRTVSWILAAALIALAAQYLVADMIHGRKVACAAEKR